MMGVDWLDKVVISKLDFTERDAFPNLLLPIIFSVWLLRELLSHERRYRRYIWILGGEGVELDEVLVI